MDNLWKHCISIGVMAKVLALKSGISAAECEEYFVSGLLHDIGKIPMIQCFPKDYAQVVQYTCDKKMPVQLIEKKLFGIDHLESGRLIAEKWNLKGAVFQCICFHNKLDLADLNHIDNVQKVSFSNIFNECRFLPG